MRSAACQRPQGTRDDRTTRHRDAQSEAAPPSDRRRPTALLPLRELVRLSLLLARACRRSSPGRRHPAGDRIEALVPDPTRSGHDPPASSSRPGRSSRSSSSRRSARSPTTRSRRWGRRKPYIVIGSLLDVVFLIGIAISNTVLASPRSSPCCSSARTSPRVRSRATCPDLVPAPQVGLASALVGLMQILGNVDRLRRSRRSPSRPATSRIAAGRARRARAGDDAVASSSGSRGPAAEDRARAALGGRSPREAWGTRRPARAQLPVPGRVAAASSSMAARPDSTCPSPTSSGARAWTTTTTRGPSLILVDDSSPRHAHRDHPGGAPVRPDRPQAGHLRRVRHRGVGMAICGPRPVVPARVLGGGDPDRAVGAGIFLAVDWALMTDIIPKASSGRYMGLSNVATASAGVLAVAVGGALDRRSSAAGRRGRAPRSWLAVGLFAIGALLLRPVDERRREDARRDRRRASRPRRSRRSARPRSTTAPSRAVARPSARQVAGRRKSHGSRRRYSHGTNAQR